MFVWGNKRPQRCVAKESDFVHIVHSHAPTPQHIYSQNKTKHQSSYNENTQNVYNSLSLPKNLYNTTNTTTTTNIINTVSQIKQRTQMHSHHTLAHTHTNHTPFQARVVAGDRSGLKRSWPFHLSTQAKTNGLWNVCVLTMCWEREVKRGKDCLTE